jgi:hypothetical protein
MDFGESPRAKARQELLTAVKNGDNLLWSVVTTTVLGEIDQEPSLKRSMLNLLKQVDEAAVSGRKGGSQSCPQLYQKVLPQ